MDNQPPKDSPFWGFIEDARAFMKEHSVPFILLQVKFIVEAAKKRGFVVVFRFNPEIDKEFLVCDPSLVCSHGCGHAHVGKDDVVDFNPDSFSFTTTMGGKTHGVSIPYRSLIDYSVLERDSADSPGLFFPAGIPVYPPIEVGTAEFTLGEGDAPPAVLH